jgi:predicted amidohydrolase YtcJ
MEPRHCAADVGGAEWRVAAGRAKWPLAWRVRSLHQAGAVLAFSSDWSVAEMDPLAASAVAVFGLAIAPDPRFCVVGIVRQASIGHRA